jgi:hypothetical protein
MKQLARFVLFVAVLGIPLTSAAALHDRGGGLFYDDLLDITWLGDANAAKSLGLGAYPPGGVLNWNDAYAFAENFEYFDTVRQVTWNDWRLPKANTTGTGLPCVGYLCLNSELGHMFYVNFAVPPGFAANASTLPAPQPYRGVFVNEDSFLNGVGTYWAGEYELNSAAAWFFSTSGGLQSVNPKSAVEGMAWLVRNGDVAIQPVPLPAAVWGLGGALLCLARLRRRA